MKITKQAKLEEIYGEKVKSRKRILELKEKFKETYLWDKAEFFSAPGRTELIGNHTDHNGGLVIAGSINMDTIGVAFPNGEDKVRITSEGYDKEIVIDLRNLRKDENGHGKTEDLVMGMLEGIVKAGFQVSGFDAYITTEVISAAGVSSSASFEMLLCSMVDYFFNSGAMSYVDYAKAGQYAENRYWGKASGLMDQLACAVGGTILLDFSELERPVYQKLDFSFHDIGCQMVIVNTGKGHADLSREYSDIPMEMAQAGAVLNVGRLCGAELGDLLEHITEIENDRAVLRSLHFYQENERVKGTVKAIEKKDRQEFLRLIRESGISSWEWLQNCYSIQDVTEQKVPLVLALTDLFLKRIGDGACRVHGGGFAGVIMCLVPEKEAFHYIDYISGFVGCGSVYPMDIRSIGTVHIENIF